MDRPALGDSEFLRTLSTDMKIEVRPGKHGLGVLEKIEPCLFLDINSH